MNEKDSVSLYVDIFKWGMVILTLTIGWGLEKSEFMDWPLPNSSTKAFATRIAFLVFGAFFWIGWSVVLERIRRRAIEAAGGGDFLGNVGLGWTHWVFCLVALLGYWYIVFDDLMTRVGAVAVLAVYVAVPTSNLLDAWTERLKSHLASLPGLRLPRS